MATPNLLGITIVSPGILNTPAQLGSGETTVYTVGAAKAAKLATLSLCNSSASPVTVSVSLVPAGGTAGVGNRLIYNFSLAAGDTTTVSEAAGAWLGASAFVSINVSAATAVTAILTGLEFS